MSTYAGRRRYNGGGGGGVGVGVDSRVGVVDMIMGHVDGSRTIRLILFLTDLRVPAINTSGLASSARLPTGTTNFGKSTLGACSGAFGFGIFGLFPVDQLMSLHGVEPVETFVASSAFERTLIAVASCMTLHVLDAAERSFAMGTLMAFFVHVRSSITTSVPAFALDSGGFSVSTLIRRWGIHDRLPQTWGKVQKESTKS